MSVYAHKLYKYEQTSDCFSKCRKPSSVAKKKVFKHPCKLEIQLRPHHRPLPLQRKNHWQAKKVHREARSHSAPLDPNGSQSESTAAESWHPRDEPGLCTPGRSRRCGFRLLGLQPRTFRTRTTGSDAVTPSCTPPCGPPGLGPAGARSPPCARVSRLGWGGALGRDF